MYESITTILHFILYVTLLTVCMKRRRLGMLPLPAVIGPWLLAFISTLELAKLAIGEARFFNGIRHLIPATWFEHSDSSSLVPGFINYATIIGFISIIGMLLLAIGIFTLARQRTQEAIVAQRPHPQEP